MARLTIEAIKHAINELRTQGKSITNQNVISLIGYGSFSTLTKFRKLYPDVFGTINNTKYNTVNTLSTVHNTDSILINAVWQRIEPHIDEHVQSVLKQQYSTTDTLVNTDNLTNNTDLQAKFEQLQSDLDMQKNSNAQLRISLDNSRMEKSELSSYNNELVEQLDIKQKALAKLVFLVTTGELGKMLGNQELGRLIDLSPSDVAKLKHKAKKYLREK